MNGDRVVIELLVEELDRDEAHAALFRRLLSDYPEQLTMEIVSAAMRRGLISAGEAIRVIRDCGLSFPRTLAELAAMGRRRGWQARDVVLDALEGQPH